MNAYLIPKNPHPGLGQQSISYPLSTRETLTIGREPSRCQILIDSSYYQGVSRVHAEIKPVNYPTTHNILTWEISDYSSNGTYINGNKIQQSHILQPGDVIQLGKDGPEFIFNYQPQAFPTRKNNDSISVSQLLPVISKENSLAKKGLLIPGILTSVFVVSLFFAGSNPNLFNTLLGLYIIIICYHVIYRACGKDKPWWLLVGVAIAEILILVSPILLLFIIVFRGILPGGIEQNNLASAFIANFFGAGLMEELLKAIPAFILIFVSRFLKSPWREKIGIWEPLDGILILAAAGAGFTFIETLGQYIPRIVAAGGELAGLQLLIPRTIGAIAGHMAYSGYFGYFIGLSMLKPSKRWLLLGIGWVTSSALHGLWNASASISANPFFVSLFLASAGIVSYMFLMAAILKARELSPSVNRFGTYQK
ncbi:PrsW family glutamic-type intramembrane protease [Gloeocapsa sp. PCC 73106]|uniref:PrsW family glutamic-type intramembrane protease n=1 Tax=Gloeocapsa sp. PCC 73106 TaxID=102232 RepID=UPI0002AC9F9C|nr:PrsW family glutamic-type intramembrane protease [Gloeocapsa sp. PCC 73106]ELR97879.1 putative membrane protein [Gloeocapsa sp. PCC 73106]